MAFKANSSAQNFQWESLPAQKKSLLKGLSEFTFIQAWAGSPVPNIFPRLFSQFFPNLGQERCFSFLFPMPELGNNVFHSHSQSQNLGTLFFIPIPNLKS